MEKKKLINIECPNPKCDSKQLILIDKNGYCVCPKCKKEVMVS